MGCGQPGVVNTARALCALTNAAAHMWTRDEAVGPVADRHPTCA